MDINDILAKNPKDWDDRELLFMGSCYLRGDGVPLDDQKCFECIKRSAEMNNKIARAFLGELYLRGCGCAVDYDKAAELCLETARIGNANSMQNLGYLYIIGKGVEQDYEKAKNWLWRCAARDEGCREYCHKLINQIGELLAAKNRNSIFGTRAPSAYEIEKIRREHLSDALLEIVKDDYYIEGEKGDYLDNTPKSQYCLSVILRREDFAGNLKEAYELLVKSAKGGYGDAYCALAGIVYHYKNTYVEYDASNMLKTVAEYLQRAADLGSARGAYLYAYVLSAGYGIKEDQGLAKYYYYLSFLRNDLDGVVTWYNMSDADKNVAMEMHKKKELERIFRESTTEQIYKIGVDYMKRCEYKTAQDYLEKAYADGYSQALDSLLINSWQSGNYQRAKECLVQKARNGDAQAQFEVGFFIKNKVSVADAAVRFSYGDTVEGTWEEWLSKACAQDHKKAIIEYASGIRNTDRNKAIELFERAYNLGDMEASRHLGTIYYELHDYFNAARWFEKTKDTEPYSAYYLANICEAQKNYEMAIVYYKKVRDMASGSLKDTAMKRLDTLDENKCMHCGAYFSKQEKKGFFGTKTICSICGNKIK